MKEHIEAQNLPLPETPSLERLFPDDTIVQGFRDSGHYNLETRPNVFVGFGGAVEIDFNTGGVA